jgi:copper homeostasis protein CutC
LALASLGVDRLLTSGRASSAWEGRANLAAIVAALDQAGKEAGGDCGGSENDRAHGGIDSDDGRKELELSCGPVVGADNSDDGGMKRGRQRPRLAVVAGAGVTAGNALALVVLSGVQEVHAGSALAEDVLGPRAEHERRVAQKQPQNDGCSGRADSITASVGVSGSGGVSMGAASAGREHLIRRTSASKVRALVESLVTL